MEPHRPADPYARLMSRVSRHAQLRLFRLFERELERRAPLPGAGIEYRLVGEEVLRPLCDEASLDLDLAKIGAAFARGDACAAAFIRGKVAGYCWFAFSATPHMDGAWIDFPPDIVYTYKSFVRPAFRGRGIAGALYRFADPLWIERGRRRAMICVETHNFASIAAAKRGRFGPAGYAGYVAGARFGVWRSPAAARLGLRLFAPCPTRSPIPQP